MYVCNLNAIILCQSASDYLKILRSFGWPERGAGYLRNRILKVTRALVAAYYTKEELRASTVKGRGRQPLSQKRWST